MIKPFNLATTRMSPITDLTGQSLTIRLDYRRGFRTILRKTRKQTTKASKKKYAILVRRIIDEKGRYVGKEVDVKSHGIRDVLRETNLDVEGLNLTKNEPVVCAIL
jgi:hypothetical protein